MPGIKEAVATVSSPGNMEMLRTRNIWTDTMGTGTSADIVIFVRGESKEKVESAIAFGQLELKAGDSENASSEEGARQFVATTLHEALEVSGDEKSKPNLVMLSVPGPSATAEALKALDEKLHVFMFSNNVSVADEVELKTFATSRGRLLMGPDCGTSLLDGVPMGFCNRVRRGSIGLIGASGTGLQQVSSLVHLYGEGVSQMIGVGGHDLSDDVGGQMMLLAMKMLEADPCTSTIVLISKPPSEKVVAKILEAAGRSSKKVVVHFVGAKAVSWKHTAYTLEDAARLAVGKSARQRKAHNNNTKAGGAQRPIFGLFSGGTFRSEAVSILKEKAPSATLIDFGDDEYTKGKPHPMIDFSTRVGHLREVAAKNPKAIVLLDVVLGHGAHEDPAGQLVGVLDEIRKGHAGVTVVAHVCGTWEDGLEDAVARLKKAGALVVDTNATACHFALDIALGGAAQPVVPADDDDAVLTRPPSKQKEDQKQAVSSIFGGIRAISIGVDTFVSAVSGAGAQVTHLKWKPPASGDRVVGLMSAEMQPGSALGDLVAAANEKALKLVQESAPLLTGVAQASEVIPFLAKGKRAILHAGPPIEWAKMCGPMQGAVIGACIFEGWAKSADEARRLAESGAIAFAPCHDHGCVGPMAGIISPSFPLWVVRNHGITTYSSMNEGLGKVLRFGAYGPDVIQRLSWIRDVLGPCLSRALEGGGGIDTFALISRALQMGDECHNRNAAATSLLFRELTPLVLDRDPDPKRASEVLQFINKNDHFFLNISMAACKAALDAGSNVKGSTLVTVMARNGVNFGLRLSGSGNKWFTTAAPVVEGLFFPGYGVADANPDMGDSSITETFGIGGAAMASAPAITGFVGGNAQSALDTTREMYHIYLKKHQRISIPSLDYRGVPVGLDALRVLETNIMPVINTGIAHREPGIGQIGAGICRAPQAVFREGVSHVFQQVHASSPPQYHQFAVRALRALKK